MHAGRCSGGAVHIRSQCELTEDLGLCAGARCAAAGGKNPPCSAAYMSIALRDARQCAAQRRIARALGAPADTRDGYGCDHTDDDHNDNQFDPS